jgi:hypothetical protein
MSYFRSDNGIKSIFGEKAFRKLVGILDPCCGGIDEVDGNPDKFLNQQGEWVEAEISCEGVNTCLGISEEGDETLVLNQKGEWVEQPGSGYIYEIGQYVAAEGGVIAHRWLSTSSLGSPTFGTIQNYLVVDTADLSTSASWATSNVNISNVESTWDGTTNTANLIAAGAGGGITAGTAAVLCNNSTNNGKLDWYLPAIDELSKIWQNRWDIAQGITNASGTQLAFATYWSSLEYDFENAWRFFFESGGTKEDTKDNMLYVRAVRKFSI